MDICDAFAFSMFLISGGRIGSRLEREYIAEEKARKQYRLLNSAIKTYKYEEKEEDNLEDIETADGDKSSSLSV